MTQDQFEVRKQRADRDVFIITAAEDGWRVRSARNPSRFYLVSASGAGLQCTCPDFEKHVQQDPAWRCKHVPAVQDYQARAGAAVHPQVEPELAEERAAIQAEATGQAQPVKGEPAPAQMLIKRSLSPDGRIDSISIEFAFALAETSVTQIRERALKTLKLQTEIVKDFLNGAGPKTNSGKASQPQAHNGNGAVFARLLDVGVSNGQYGERFYLNVQVNGRRARFFGTADQIANAITVAGEQIYATAIEPGMHFNLPCRVLTERSRDGRYLNVKQVLPLSGPANGRVR